MTVRSLLLLSALLVAATSLTGCLQTCQQLCIENARYVDGCLEEWDALWSDFGYDGRDEETGEAFEGGPAEEYVTDCRGRYSAVLSQISPEAGRDVRQGCEEDLEEVAAAVGCNDYTPNDATLNPNE